MLRALRELALSLAVPPLCAVCREPELENGALCPECRSRLVALPSTRCMRCGTPAVFEADGCRECRGRALAFARAWAPFAYEGTCRHVVGALKSRGATALAELAANELAGRAPAALRRGTLVPVPAHRGRRRRDGFNPAELIARPLARRWGGEVTTVLARRPGVAPQTGLARRARLANGRDSVLLRPGAIVPERALLIDDVYTTGATLDACARALVAGGAREVAALTVARAVRG